MRWLGKPHEVTGLKVRVKCRKIKNNCPEQEIPLNRTDRGAAYAQPSLVVQGGLEAYQIQRIVE